MSKADEMFEKLGYEKMEDSKTNIGCIYVNYKKYSMFQTIVKIIFHYKTKKITIANEYMTMQELQAINEKVKELGWNE